jgi:hypothetical protein
VVNGTIVQGSTPTCDVSSKIHYEKDEMPADGLDTAENLVILNGPGEVPQGHNVNLKGPSVHCAAGIRDIALNGISIAQRRGEVNTSTANEG